MILCKDYSYMYNIKDILFAKIINNKFDIFSVVQKDYGFVYSQDYFNKFYTNIKDDVVELNFCRILKPTKLFPNIENKICRIVLKERVEKYDR